MPQRWPSLVILTLAIAVAACSTEVPASVTPSVGSLGPTASPTEPVAALTPSPTPGPTVDLVLTKGEQALADLLPAALAARCRTVTSTTYGFVDGVICLDVGFTATLAHFTSEDEAAFDQFDARAPGVKRIVCPQGDRLSGDYGIGARFGGTVRGCESGDWLSWYVVATGIYGRVDITGGDLKAAIAWFVQGNPTGQSGPVYGAGSDPIIPRLSYAKLASVAEVVSYKTLLRKTATYQDHLVRFSGEVKVDGPQARVWVDHGRTGLLDDLVSLDTTDLDVRLAVSDQLDFVGFVNGRTAGGVGDIPVITLLSYRLR